MLNFRLMYAPRIKLSVFAVVKLRRSVMNAVVFFFLAALNAELELAFCFW